MIVSLEICAIALYVAILFVIGYFSYKPKQTSDDFLLASRSLNYILTAMAAHASDMSTWLFMGFPALVYLKGLSGIYLAMGLLFFMFLNWMLVAPRLRIKTEAFNSLTISSFFESAYHDKAGYLRPVTAFISLIFYTIYISAGIMGLGLVLQTLFSINYLLAISIGVLIIIPYLLIGGYKTLAWLDCFQAIFLLLVILVVPFIAFNSIGGMTPFLNGLKSHSSAFTQIIPASSEGKLLAVATFFSWGLGYFGQPHIITKFMGIKNPKEIKKSMMVGISWQALTLAAAVFVGSVGVVFFTNTLLDPQMLFVFMVKDLFPPFLAAFILCAIIAATVSTMDSQILVLATCIVEDLYRKVFKKDADSKHLLKASRLCIIGISLVSFVIASFQFDTILSIVYIAWAGLGASFGPVMLIALFSKKTSALAALVSIITGCVACLIFKIFSIQTTSLLIPAFILSFIAYYTTLLIQKISTPTTLKRS
ncbi:sodium:proline symporter [Candidatus Aerophobetes bacterium]|uniref:Sodium/proline symporter n=1 Tax=Aerophobetes bacterium TaxID=2030807 RepID=A0A2A4X5Y7_UNCAE|nr:MAG: sodium:proline symporter [Candidatus Aerophobetes bacterium]